MRSVAGNECAALSQLVCYQGKAGMPGRHSNQIKNERTANRGKHRGFEIDRFYCLVGRQL